MKKIERNLLIIFLQGALNGVTTMADWAGPGRFMTRSEYVNIRDALLAVGALEPTPGRSRGVRATEAATEWLERLTTGGELALDGYELQETLRGDGLELPWFAKKEVES